MLEKPRYPDRAQIDDKLKNEWIAERKEALGGKTIRHRRTNYPPIEESIPPVIQQLGQFDLSKYSRSNYQDGVDENDQSSEQGRYPDELPQYIPVQKNQWENNWSANKVNSVPFSKKKNWNQGRKNVYPSVPISSWTENQVRENTPKEIGLI